MSQFNNSKQAAEYASAENVNNLSKQRKKTGPSPKYGPDQAKKMVSMRLSPDALNSIKKAAEIVFKDSQADVVEKMMRYFPPEALQKICNIAEKYELSANDVLSDALDLFEEQKKKELATA